MKSTKIVIIGAGSAMFGMNVLRDAYQFPELTGSELWLVDIDEERLSIMKKLADRFNEESGANLKIFSDTDRKRALPSAEFVIISIAIKRNDLWKLDWKIPLKYGVKHVLGENGGPGGLSHSLRNIPVIMEIVNDMEKLSPSALLMNFTNPESRICRAINKYSNIKSVGLCHGIFDGINNVSFITGVPYDDIDVIVAGINHLQWVLKIQNKKTKEDLYPLLSESCKSSNHLAFMPFSKYIFDKFDLYPFPDDKHIGEYFSYAHQFIGLSGYDFDVADWLWEEQWKLINKMVNFKEPVKDLISTRSGEIAFDIICDILCDKKSFRPSVNIPNKGCIENLPDNAIVEIPATVGKDGIKGTKIGKLPIPIAAVCNQQIAIQELAVDSAIKGDKSLALQALLIDPVIQSADAAENILDEFLSVHKEYLPQFK